MMMSLNSSCSLVSFTLCSSPRGKDDGMMKAGGGIYTVTTTNAYDDRT